MRKAINHLKKADPVLAALIERVGPYRIQYREPVFETLVRSIVYQQLSGKAAKVIFERLAAATGQRLTPEAILKLTPRRMRSLGLSKAKTDYVRDLAARTLAGEVQFENCTGMDDEALIEHLTAVKGVGVWTAQMFLIFALRRPDVLPVADLGIRSAMRNVYGLPELPKADKVRAIAECWRPYCSVASWYLWRSLDGPAAL